MTERTYKFENRIELAATLPSAWNFDPQIFEAEKRAIFARTWQLVGRTDMVTQPGQYFTTSVGDEPLVVVRDTAHKLRAFSNVCRHRAGPVATGRGQRKVFKCGYHGWTYSLEGGLIGTPDFELVQCWMKEANGLPEFKVDTWGALVFVNLDCDSEPIAKTVGGIENLFREPHNLAGMSLASRKEWHVGCNWKVYVDNYLEGYHIPVVHPALSRALDYTKYRTKTGRFYSVQRAPLKNPEHPEGEAGLSGDSCEALYYWVFPNLMINIYPDNYSTNLIVPIGAEETLTVFEWYFRDPEQLDTQQAIGRVIEFSDEIQREDMAICEAVQKGLRSRSYNSGRYSVKRESGVHHFHGLVAEFLNRS